MDWPPSWTSIAFLQETWRNKCLWNYYERMANISMSPIHMVGRQRRNERDSNRYKKRTGAKPMYVCVHLRLRGYAYPCPIHDPQARAPAHGTLCLPNLEAPAAIGHGWGCARPRAASTAEQPHSKLHDAIPRPDQTRSSEKTQSGSIDQNRSKSIKNDQKRSTSIKIHQNRCHQNRSKTIKID